MLDFPAPRLLCYSRESAIAEKFEAMVKLGVLNSRMKDFYDIWLLSRRFDFNGAKLTDAIRLTFERRETAVPAKVEAFENAFIHAKQIQWAAFRQRLQQDHIPDSFHDIVSSVEAFSGTACIHDFSRPPHGRKVELSRAMDLNARNSPSL